MTIAVLNMDFDLSEDVLTYTATDAEETCRDIQIVLTDDLNVELEEGFSVEVLPVPSDTAVVNIVQRQSLINITDNDSECYSSRVKKSETLPI